MSYTVCPCCCQKPDSAGTFCRPATLPGPIPSSTADGYFQWPVDISSSRWCSIVFRGPIPELWKFSEKQGSVNRGSSGMVRTFRARWVRACIIRTSRGGGCGHLSFFICSQSVKLIRNSVIIYLLIIWIVIFIWPLQVRAMM